MSRVAEARSERAHADQPAMQPESEDQPRNDTRDHSLHIACKRAHGIGRAGYTIAPSRGCEREDRPDKKRTEQQDVAQISVRQEMRERPRLDPRRHGVTDLRLDPVAADVRSS